MVATTFPPSKVSAVCHTGLIPANDARGVTWITAQVMANRAKIRGPRRSSTNGIAISGLRQIEQHQRSQQNTMSKTRSDHDHGRLLPNGNGAQAMMPTKNRKAHSSRKDPRTWPSFGNNNRRLMLTSARS